MRCTLASRGCDCAVSSRSCGKGTQAADVLVVLAVEVELESLVDELDEDEELDASAVAAAGVSVLGLLDEPLEVPDRLSVL